MNPGHEVLALQQALTTCRTHRQALREALEDLDQRSFMADDLARLTKEDRRLLDQFAYRYTRMQDDMDTRLFATALAALGEDVARMPVVDRLDRLEQLGWLPSAEEWMDLRRVRNEFTHEYPQTEAERSERLRLALESAHRLLEIFETFEGRIRERFGGRE